MVMSVCRGVLGDVHEAEDAFQATFLVLLRDARAIRKRESVGSWLHGVAHRVASRARADSARRRTHERRWSERRRDATGSAPDDFDLPATIHAELARLPERYRAPIVLCDLEERSLDEAARQLGWPLGTVKSRLNRGRQRLRDRLVRRGVAPAVAALASTGLADAAAPVPAALAEAAARMMTAAGGLSAAVPALVEGAGRMTLLARIQPAAALLIAVGLSALGVGALASAPRRGAPAAIEADPQEGVRPPKADAPGAPFVSKGQDPHAPLAATKAHAPGEASHRETVTFSGRATDEAGRPVAGATIYILDINGQLHPGDRDIVARAVTGPDGRYIARDVGLRISGARPEPLERPWGRAGTDDDPRAESAARSRESVPGGWDGSRVRPGVVAAHLLPARETSLGRAAVVDLSLALPPRAVQFQPGLPPTGVDPRQGGRRSGPAAGRREGPIRRRRRPHERASRPGPRPALVLLPRRPGSRLAGEFRRHRPDARIDHLDTHRPRRGLSAGRPAARMPARVPDRSRSWVRAASGDVAHLRPGPPSEAHHSATGIRRRARRHTGHAA